MVWKLLASSHCILKHSPKGDLWSQNSSWCFPLNETPCMPCFLHRWLHVAIFSQRMLPMYLDHIWTSFLAQVFPTVHLDILQVQGEYQSMCNRLHYPDGKEFADYWSLWPHWMGQPILPNFGKMLAIFDQSWFLSQFAKYSNTCSILFRVDYTENSPNDGWCLNLKFEPCQRVVFLHLWRNFNWICCLSMNKCGKN